MDCGDPMDDAMGCQRSEAWVAVIPWVVAVRPMGCGGPAGCGDPLDALRRFHGRRRSDPWAAAIPRLSHRIRSGASPDRPQIVPESAPCPHARNGVPRILRPPWLSGSSLRSRPAASRPSATCGGARARAASGRQRCWPRPRSLAGRFFPWGRLRCGFPPQRVLRGVLLPACPARLPRPPHAGSRRVELARPWRSRARELGPCCNSSDGLAPATPATRPEANSITFPFGSDRPACGWNPRGAPDPRLPVARLRSRHPLRMVPMAPVLAGATDIVTR